FTWDSEDLTRDEAMAARAWRQARDAMAAGAHQLVVLDEITYPMNWGWIDTAEVVAAIDARPSHVNVVCTGRDAPAALIEVADTVSRVDAVKHAYEQGIRAKKGIDY
ncbi:MAG TPA: cob(I)yrinic acid a,c-diamide adenosyltransferase, partial [Acidimicrobiales bacterium]|nr:cob(I)yrinic acid a,c-diamide adenosyltransferase [Acidimicrobiales bacterium]